METRSYLSISIKLILVLSIINSIYFSLWHIMSANLFLLILLYAPQIIKSSYKIIFPKQFEIALLIFIVINLILGRLYEFLSPLIFGISTGFIALFILFILYSSNQIKRNVFLVTFFSFIFAISFGAIIELLKYYLKLILGQGINEGIYSFTMMNLTYVFLGASIASVTGLIYMKTIFSLLSGIIKKFTILNKNVFPANKFPNEVMEEIKDGENEIKEFKSTLRTNLHTNQIDKKIEQSVLKTICAFLNTKGGTLFVGVTDSKKILGIKKDYFENNDKFQLHLINLIKQNIGKKYLDLINPELIRIKNHYVLRVECKKSGKPVFLKDGENEYFYIRSGPQTVELKGSELIGYINRFSSFSSKPL
ncbi:MAG: putative DNA binding domain-containing protein [archaeon]|nr:putative DNA binding domain-containing protein [archaeon]